MDGENTSQISMPRNEKEKGSERPHVNHGSQSATNVLRTQCTLRKDLTRAWTCTSNGSGNYLQAGGECQARDVGNLAEF